MKQFKIIIEKHPDGYVAYPIGLKGVVVGQGDTGKEALADAEAVRAIFQRDGVKRVVSVEGNATAPFASVLRTAGALDACDHVLRYDGMPFTGEEIRARVRE